MWRSGGTSNKHSQWTNWAQWQSKSEVPASFQYQATIKVGKQSVVEAPVSPSPPQPNEEPKNEHF
jgi:hypothetical protein